MRDDLLALLLMLGGLGCIVAWGTCQIVGAIRAYQLRREEDAIKLYVVKGGRLPEGAPMVLARSHLQLRWLGLLGNLLLLAGIVVMVLAHALIF
jgi:hypothetical protein